VEAGLEERPEFPWCQETGRNNVFFPKALARKWNRHGFTQFSKRFPWTKDHGIHYKLEQGKAVGCGEYGRASGAKVLEKAPRDRFEVRLEVQDRAVRVRTIVWTFLPCSRCGRTRPHDDEIVDSVSFRARASGLDHSRRHIRGNHSDAMFRQLHGVPTGPASEFYNVVRRLESGKCRV